MLKRTYQTQELFKYHSAQEYEETNFSIRNSICAYGVFCVQPIHSKVEGAKLCHQAIKTKSYKHESQWICKSELSKKSAENTLGGVCELREARTIPPPLQLLPPPTPGISSQSMLSRVGSSKSRLAGWGEKLRSLVSIGDVGWSRIL